MARDSQRAVTGVCGLCPSVDVTRKYVCFGRLMHLVQNGGADLGNDLLQATWWDSVMQENLEHANP